VTPSGRVALVTGGTGALGQAVTRKLLAAGDTVYVPYIVDAERAQLQAVVKGDEAGRLVIERVDVADATALGRFIDAARARQGRLDALVTLIGGFAGGSLLETDRATWDRMLDLNLTTVFTTTRAVVPHMVAAGRGRVVTIGSRAAVPPGAGFIAYTVAKAGVVAFTQALAQELRGSGVTANCVLPSTMDTAANRAAMPAGDRKGWVPVESVAAAITFLASEEASHVSGALVTV
jgi:NAD(P)-dependent dehydrogenase (short-subunit alcohol dehydrogenase family)